MTADRDDPEGRSRSAKNGSADAVSVSAADVALCETVTRIAGGALLRQGFPPLAVALILDDTVQKFRMFRQSIKEPSEFLVKRILAKAQAYRKLRGMKPGSDPEEEAPALLDIIHTRPAVQTLNRHARIAIEVLYYRHGTFDDVAEALEVDPAYVPRLVEKALNQLRKWRPRPEPAE